MGDGYRARGFARPGTSRPRRSKSIERAGPRASRAACFGPDLETQLRPHGLTLRHFPQSFQFSTLGGWIVTRAGGHYATLETHIDEFVQSVRMVTPAGVLATRRLPGSGAGPDANRLVHRLRRCARRRHRGVDAAAGPAAIPCLGVRRASATSSAAAQLCSRTVAVRLESEQLPPARPGGGRVRRGRRWHAFAARARLRVGGPRPAGLDGACTRARARLRRRVRRRGRRAVHAVRRGRR